MEEQICAIWVAQSQADDVSASTSTVCTLLSIRSWRSCVMIVAAKAAENGPGYSFSLAVLNCPNSSTPIKTAEGLGVSQSACLFITDLNLGRLTARSPVGLTEHAPNLYCSTWCRKEFGCRLRNSTMAVVQVLGRVESKGFAGCSPMK